MLAPTLLRLEKLPIRLNRAGTSALGLQAVAAGGTLSLRDDDARAAAAGLRRRRRRVRWDEGLDGRGQGATANDGLRAQHASVRQGVELRCNRPAQAPRLCPREQDDFEHRGDAASRAREGRRGHHHRERKAAERRRRKTVRRPGLKFGTPNSL
eukprot:SAG31_NODE_4408_length_3258_cov_4.000633_2_plen_154_part_00